MTSEGLTSSEAFRNQVSELGVVHPMMHERSAVTSRVRVRVGETEGHVRVGQSLLVADPAFPERTTMTRNVLVGMMKKSTAERASRRCRTNALHAWKAPCPADSRKSSIVNQNQHVSPWAADASTQRSEALQILRGLRRERRRGELSLLDVTLPPFVS